MERITPENITILKPSEIFVFGSNEAGYHGAGAAKAALILFGAKWGKGTGFQGESYAIPTKDESIISLNLKEIETYVNNFIEDAKNEPHFNFLVTKIGCGLAGFTVKEIAPLFKSVINLENVSLPIEFIKEIKNAKCLS
ncbi:hypothetical protein HOC11_02995 [archaeon]|jgi:hypothetical protein|nr:hypothetical protein [archaeon]